MTTLHFSCISDHSQTLQGTLNKSKNKKMTHRFIRYILESFCHAHFQIRLNGWHWGMNVPLFGSFCSGKKPTAAK